MPPDLPWTLDLSLLVTYRSVPHRPVTYYALVRAAATGHSLPLAELSSLFLPRHKRRHGCSDVTVSTLSLLTGLDAVCGCDLNVTVSIYPECHRHGWRCVYCPGWALSG